MHAGELADAEKICKIIDYLVNPSIVVKNYTIIKSL